MSSRSKCWLAWFTTLALSTAPLTAQTPPLGLPLFEPPQVDSVPITQQDVGKAPRRLSIPSDVQHAESTLEQYGQARLLAAETFTDEADPSPAKLPIIDSIDSSAPPVVKKSKQPFEPGTFQLGATIPSNEKPLAETVPIEHRDRLMQKPVRTESRVGLVPILALEAIGPRNLIQGEQAKYSFVIRNLGETPADNVSLILAFPENAAMESCQRTYKTDNDGNIRIDLGTIRAAAELSTIVDVRSETRGVFHIGTRLVFSAAGDFAVNVTQPEIEAALEGPDMISYGELDRFILHVTNTGDGEATNVRVTCRMPPGFVADQPGDFTTEIPTLNAGETKDILVPLMAETTGAATLDFRITADQGLIAQATKTLTVTRPTVDAEVRGPSVVYLDHEVIYAIVVNNPSKLPVSDVKIRLSIPSGLNVTSIDQKADFDANEPSLTWSIPSISAGKSHKVQLKATAVAAGSQLKKVKVTAAENVKNEFSHETMIISRPDINLVVQEKTHPVKVGEPTQFTVTLSNRGTKATEGVSVRIFLPEGLIPGESGSYSVSDRVLTYHPFAMKASQMVNLQFEATGQKSGDHIVRATMKHADIDHELSAEESVFFYEPSQVTEEPRQIEIR